MTEPSFQSTNPLLAGFHSAHPDFDLLTADLHDRKAIAALLPREEERPEMLRTLKRYQRVARLGASPAQAETLLGRGFDSAHRVAAFAEHRFIADQADAPDLTPADLKAIHQTATGIAARAAQATAFLRGYYSPYSRAARFLTPHPELDSALADLPDYQDLFGGLDYCQCQHCQSVPRSGRLFHRPHAGGLRIYHHPERHSAGLALKDRRPDLFAIPLTCASTNTLVSTLSIINTAVAKVIATTLGQDPDYALATSVFPATLPINTGLACVRTCVKAMGIDLAGVYRAFAQPSGSTAAQPTAAQIAIEQLGLSVEQAAVVTTPVTSAALGQYFGDPATGVVESLVAMAVSLGDVSIASGTSITGIGFNASGVAVGWVVQVADGLRVVTAVSDTVLTVDFAWYETVTGYPGTAYPPQSIVQLSVFCSQSGLAMPEAIELFQQNLSPTELNSTLPYQFYINQANSAGMSVQCASDLSDPNYSLEVLQFLTATNLDRINRFLRLRSGFGWTVSDLNWAVMTSGQTEINSSCLTVLAQVATLSAQLKMAVDELCGLWFDLKTYGRGTEAQPKDLFDRVFNSTRPDRWDNRPTDRPMPTIRCSPARSLPGPSPEPTTTAPRFGRGWPER